MHLVPEDFDDTTPTHYPPIGALAKLVIAGSLLAFLFLIVIGALK